jgi:hypothetical protein
MMTTSRLARLAALGFALAACRSEVLLGTGSTDDPLLGTAGHPPKSDGTCNAGLVTCAGLCQVACAAPGTDAGLDAATDTGASDAGTPTDTGSDVAVDASPLPPSGVIATGVRKVFSIAVDDTAVYWAEDVDSARAKATDPKTGKITKLLLAGGSPIDLAVGEDAPVTIALSGTDIYWGTTGVLQTVPGGVYKAPVAGGARTTVVSATAGIDQILIAGGQLYWAVQDFNVVSGTGGIWTGNLDGSSASLLMSNASLFQTFAVVGGDVYMNSAGLLKRSGSAESSMFANGNFGLTTATDGTSLYFVSFGGALEKSPVPLVNGGTVAVIDPAPSGRTVAYYSTMAVDGTNVYWTSCTTATPTSCNLYREATSGGGATVLGTQPGTQGCVAVSATHVYWGVDGAILRFPK